MSLRRAALLVAYSITRDRSVLTPFTLRNSVRAAATSSSPVVVPQAQGTINGVDHVVLLKVKQGTSKSQIKKFQEGILSLHAVPGVTSVSVGESFVERWMADRRDGFTLGLCVRLESKKALKEYQDHELHTRVKAECIAPIAESAIAIDWESILIPGTPSKKEEHAC
jgi:hypothetical protein